MNEVRVDELLLVERDDDLARFASMLSLLSAGVGRLVVVQGPPGIGKTRLAAEATRMAVAGGVRVLSARGHPIESGLSFGVARQLFERALTDLAPAERRLVLSGAARLSARIIGSAAEAEPSLFPAMHGLYWLTANLADQCPLMLVVDDAHWADDGSLRWLTYLAQRLKDIPVVVLVTRWPASLGPVTPPLDALTGDCSTEVMTVKALTQSGVGLLARGLTGRAADDDDLADLHRRTGGNPFFIREVLLAGGDGSAAGVPVNVARSAAARVGALSEDARKLAAATAVLSTDATPGRAAAVAGIAAADADAARDELARANIFSSDDGLAFVHPLIREAVYSGLAGGERSRLHRRASAVLAEHHIDVERRAMHLLSSTPEADATSIDVLRAAAARARSRGDHQAASAYLARAQEEGGPGAAGYVLLLELGASLSLWNPTAAIGPLETAHAVAPDADARLLVAMELAQVRTRLADLAGAYTVLERALDERPQQTDPDMLLSAEGGLLTTGALAPALVARALERLTTITIPAGDTPGERLLLSGIARVRLTGPDPWDGLFDVIRRAIGKGQVLTDRTADAGAFASLVWPMLVTGLFEEATDLIDQFSADASRRGSLVNLALATHLSGVLAVLRGDVHAALDCTARALELSVATGYGVVLPTATAFRARALVHADRVNDADDLLRAHGFSDEIPDIAIQFHALLRARAEVRLAQGRADAALKDLRDLGKRHAAAGIDEESMAWRSLASQAALILGRRDEALSLAHTELARATRKGVQSSQARAQLALGKAVGGTEGLALLRQAVTLFSSTSFELDHAHALAELGHHLLHSRHKNEAKAPLLQALDMATRLGATALTNSTTRDLHSCGTRPRRSARIGPDALTPAERRVADLAAQDHSNAEIAQRLFISRKSVEFHLTNSYRKLQVNSRRGLNEALGKTQPGSQR